MDEGVALIPCRDLFNQEATPPSLLLAGYGGVAEADPAFSLPRSTAGLGPGPARKAGPPLSGLLRPPSGAVLQPGGHPSSQPPTPQLALPWAPAAFPGAPGPSGPGHGAESPRSPAGGHPGRTQCGARAQLRALDPGTRGLGELPKLLWASLYPVVTCVCVVGMVASSASFQT